MNTWDLLYLASMLFVLGMLGTGVVAFIQQTQRWVWGSLLPASVGGSLLVMLSNWMQKNGDATVSTIILMLALILIGSGAFTMTRMFRHGPLQLMATATLAVGIIVILSSLAFFVFG
jgi:hypothetical protein